MIDSLSRIAPRAREARPWEAYGLATAGYGLVTLHRPALVDQPELLAETMHALAGLAEEIPLVFPVHPRTRNRITALGLDTDTGRLQLTEPLGYIGFAGLEAGARFVLTDSGGIQEETSALGVPCFTLRDSTERPVTLELGTNTLLGLDPASIGEIPRHLGAAREVKAIPFWDGHAGERAAVVLASFLEQSRTAAGTAA
jgi:UDP-N-acetylglucosamine 2-epimerase (non-hydrolysing)